MRRERHHRPGASLLLAAGFALLTSLPLNLPAAAAPPLASLVTSSGVPIDDEVAAVWETQDGPVAAGGAERAWTWGPQPLATVVEHAADSPTGTRTLVYFDKGRLDVMDPDAPPGTVWAVAGGLLVAQLMSGALPVGDGQTVQRGASTMPVAGDLDQPAPVTYASLGTLASIDGRALADETSPAPVIPARVGDTLTDELQADGSVGATGPPVAVTIGAYDEVTGHNIAAPFVAWATGLAGNATWLLGRPLTEPYWVDTVVSGTPKPVLVQAFERRLLTYTPDNDPIWQVESANVGQHYRLWRGLSQPGDTGYVSLASFEPYGEELVGAALAHGLDPYLLVAASRAASGGDPTATRSNGGVGLVAVRPATAEAHGGGDLRDPARNAGYAARLLRQLTVGGGDLGAALRVYYGAGDDFDSFTSAALAAYDQLRATHPMTFELAATTPRPDPASHLGTGRAAYYAPSYDVAWWERTLRLYESWGNIAAGWQDDPNGFYCVRPGYIPGQRLLLVANGVTITCTIGDTVQAAHVPNWNANWVVELNWPAFVALGLDRNNAVEVYHVGAWG